MSRMWIDSHCHLADARFAPDLEEALGEAQKQGIGGWLQGGIDPEDWARQRKIKERFGDKILTCFGLHPWWVSSASDSQIEGGLSALEASLPQARGLGELGLDKSLKFKENFERQRPVFEAQLAL